MKKSYLLKNAKILTKDAECISGKNVYISDGKILKIMDSTSDDGNIRADEEIDCGNTISVREFQTFIPIRR